MKGQTNQWLIAVLLWTAMLTIGWLAYAPALTGVFLLDDLPNLAGLGAVNDSESAIYFVFSGTAGPVGRPLALATFLLQEGAWGGGAEPFLRINILIHLVNACVLAWLLHRLSLVRGTSNDFALTVGIVAAAIWLVMPLLATSSLMVIQRMTTLSASFVLLGLAGYLWARQSIAHRPKVAMTGMSAALSIGTSLAVLTKENGILLPTIVLVMEATLLLRPTNVTITHWRVWKAIFLVVPTATIFAYLAWRIPYGDAVVLLRDFTAWERLLTESRVLWQYLFYAFLPQSGNFGPYHDGYAVARTILDPVTFLAFAGWLAVVILAVVRRRRYPLFAFAILWFLGAHLLESTVIPLDLYFEHRNYIPIIGPVYALCALAFSALVQHRKYFYAGSSVYILLNAFVLFSFSSLWGNPAVASEVWRERFPASKYAITAAIRRELAVEGPRSALQSLRKAVVADPGWGYLKIYELKLACDIAPQSDHTSTVTETVRLLEHVDFSYTPLTMLSHLLETVSSTECNGVDRKTVTRLATTLIQNPRYSGDARYNQLHYQFMALISQQEGMPHRAIRNLEIAMGYKQSTALNRMMVITLTARKDFDAARAFIEKARGNAPLHPLRSFVWFRKLDDLSDFVAKQKRVADREDMSGSRSIIKAEFP